MGQGRGDPFRTTRRGRGADGGIDFVAARTDVFGPGSVTTTYVTDLPVEPVAPAAFGDEPAGRRRGPWVLGAAVTALVGLGVVAAAPWQDDAPSAAPTTTAAPRPVTTAPTTAPPTSAAPSSSATPSAADLLEGNLGYVLDTSAMAGPLVATGGNRIEPGLARHGPQTWIAAWATRGSTHASGTWVIAQIRDGSDGSWFGQDRLDLSGTIAQHQLDADGIRHLLFPLGEGASLLLTARGWDEGALAALARQTTGGPDGVVVPSGAIPDNELPLLNTTTTTVWSALAPVRIDIAAMAEYGTSDADRVFVYTAAHDATWEALRPLLGGGDELSTGPSVHHLIGGRDVVVSAIDLDVLDRQYLVAEWDEDGATVQLITPRPLAEVLAMVPLVHRGTDAEWAAIETAREADPPPSDTVAPAALSTIATGTASDGTTWSVVVDDTAAHAELEVGLPEGSAQLRLDPDRPLRVLAGPTLTWVTCVLPAAGAPATMQVTTTSGTIDVPFHPIGTTGTVVATYAFSETWVYRVHAQGSSSATTIDAAYGIGT